MIVITIATLTEARAIIEHFYLSKADNKDFNIYKNNEILLIITGIGIIRAKKSTRYIIDYIGSNNINHIYNIGIAGCIDENIKIGSIFFINKIINKDETIIIETPNTQNIRQCSISSFQVPIQKSQKSKMNTTLVDMEAKGFFEASSDRLEINQISIIKIVSDHLIENENEKFSKQKIISLMRESIGEIDFSHR